MLKYGKAMKELAEDFKSIWKKDRRLIWWMTAQFAVSVWLFLLSIINLNPNRPKVYARYSDISNGYAQSDWWYLASFAVIAIVLGIGHNLLSAKLFGKRGGDIARLFLGVSVMITIIAIRFLLSLIRESI